jgi:ethanolamine utilization protein EutQ
MPLLFTAADIRRIAREQKSDLLVLGPADLITPEAVDVAKELGVRLVRDAERGTTASVPARAAIGAAPSFLPPLKVVHGGGLALEAFGAGPAAHGTDVRLRDVVTPANGSPVAAGYMTLDAERGGPQSGGEFPWTLDYDEIDVVLEGELVIARGREVVRGGPGDVIFIPKGSSITFGTPKHTRFVYVAFPADWNK